MKTILHLLSAILVCIGATGCKINSSGWPVIPFMNNGKAKQDDRINPLNIDKLPQQREFRIETAVINPNFPKVCTFDFDLPEPVNVIGLDKTTNGIDWQSVYLNDPHLWIGLGHQQVRLTNSEPFAFFRVWVRNTP